MDGCRVGWGSDVVPAEGERVEGSDIGRGDAVGGVGDRSGMERGGGWIEGEEAVAFD